MNVNVPFSLFALRVISQPKSKQICNVYEKVSCEKEGKERNLHSHSVPAACGYNHVRLTLCGSLGPVDSGPHATPYFASLHITGGEPTPLAGVVAKYHWQHKPLHLTGPGEFELVAPPIQDLASNVPPEKTWRRRRSSWRTFGGLGGVSDPTSSRESNGQAWPAKSIDYSSEGL
ncbi:hypothetical protein V500_02348 [Pseudogymnoascus sp. VKM F-4518 (FW-2643)]|nr:hypothetical protein V500_02348 [Pseudogymnoascus sp. VKM F-4518 (FW-2643)]